MSFQATIKKLIADERLDDTGVLLSVVAKDCKCEEDLVQYVQLKTLLDTQPSFLSTLVSACKNGTYCAELARLSALFDGENISAHVYAYFLYATIAACGIKSGIVEWIDPTKNTLREEQYGANDKTFGTGAFVESFSDFAITREDNALKKFSGKRKMVTVPYGVRKIKRETFAQNGGIKWVTLPQSATELDEKCFEGCKNLQIVLLSDGVEELPEECFSGCESLSLAVGSGVKKIGKKAFYGCNITNFKRLGGGKLQTIAPFAFARCKSLKSATLSRVTVGRGAFYECTQLSSLTIEEGANIEGGRVLSLFAKDEGDFRSAGYGLKEVKYTCENGVLPARLFAGCNCIESIEILGEVKEIGESAFEDCSALKSLKINFTGETLPKRAFYRCKALEAIPELPRVSELQANALYGCESLRELRFSRPVELCGEGVFEGCIALESLPLTLATGILPKNTFRCCAKLKTLDFIKTVTEIHAGALEGCTFSDGLILPKNILLVQKGAFHGASVCGTLQLPVGKTWEREAFSAVKGIVSLVLEGTEFPAEGEALPPYALFAPTVQAFCTQCAELINLKVLSARLSEGAFRGWRNLKKVILAGDTPLLPARLFEDCTALEGVKLASTRLELGEGAFFGCSSLKRIRFAGEKQGGAEIDLSCVTRLHANALGGCGLEEVRLPASCTVEGKPFEGCLNLRSLQLELPTEGEIAPLYSLFADSVSDLNECYASFTALELFGATRLPADYLKGYSRLQSITLSTPIAEMGEGCFALLSSVEKIVGEYLGSALPASAFEGCERLRALPTLSRVERLGARALFGCASLQELQLKTVSELAESCLEGCSQLAQITGELACAQVGSRAFYGCAALQSLRFIQPVTEVGAFAFSGCEQLKTVAMDYAGELLAEGVFSGCAALEETPNIKRVKRIASGAFAGCKSLSAVKVGALAEGTFSEAFADGLKTIKRVEYASAEIGNGYFNGFSALEELTCDCTLTEIGAVAFVNTPSLTRLPSLNGVRAVGVFAFAGSGISSLSFENELRFLGAGAFAGCTRLEYLRLPVRFELFGSLFDWTSREDARQIVQKIGERERKFYLPASLQKVVLTDGELSEGALSGLWTDVELTHPLTRLPARVFEDFSGTLKLNAERVEEVGRYAFAHASVPSLSLPRVQVIEEGAFRESSLKSLSLGGEIRSIARDALSATAVEQMKLEGGERYALTRSMLVDLQSGELIYVVKDIRGKVTVPTEARKLVENAFAGCKEITSVDCSSLSEVGAGAFRDCTALERVSLSREAERLGEGLFVGCVALKELRLPFLGAERTSPCGMEYFLGRTATAPLSLVVAGGTVSRHALGEREYPLLDLSGVAMASLPREWLRGVSAERLILPESLEKIEAGAFAACSFGEALYGGAHSGVCISSDCIYSDGVLVYRYANAEELVIAERTQTIYEQAFDRNIEASALTLLSGVALDKMDCNLFAKFKGIERLRVDCELPYTLKQLLGGSFMWLKEVEYAGKRVVNEAFANLPSLAKISLPNVENLSENCFARATSLTALDLPSVKRVTATAFAHCKSLRTVAFSNGLEELAESVFDGLALNELRVEEGGSYSTQGGYLTDGAGTVLYAPKGLAGEVALFDGVQKVRARAFADCSLMTALTANGLSVIEKEAFAGCTSLQTVEIRSAEAVEDNAFTGCAALTRFALLDGEKIGSAILQNCEGVNELTVPFVGRSNEEGEKLAYLFGEHVPESLKTVCLARQTTVEKTFVRCTGLEKIILKNARLVKGKSLYKCNRLRTLTLADAVEKIEDYALLGANENVVVELSYKGQDSKFDKKWNVIKKGFLFAFGERKAKVTVV